MLTSKRQEWILQMIKGPDLTPVSNCPGHYTCKSTINLAVGNQQFIIRTADVLDLSSPEFLMIQADNEQEFRIPWERITSLEFEEPEWTVSVKRPHTQTIPHRMLPFPAGKKLV
jgi:hypothetical protein